MLSQFRNLNKKLNPTFGKHWPWLILVLLSFLSLSVVTFQYVVPFVHTPVKAQQGLPIIANGTSAYTIVTSQNPSLQDEFAAQELQDYLFRISGVTVPIVNQIPPQGNLILIGQAAGGWFPEISHQDGFIARVDGTNILLAGNNGRATLYAVYHFLETLGVRFYYPVIPGVNPEDNLIPRYQEVWVESDLNLVENPDFDYRLMATEYATDPSKQYFLNEIDWFAKNKMNWMMADQYDVDSSYEPFYYRGNNAEEIDKRGLDFKLTGHDYIHLYAWYTGYSETFCVSGAGGNTNTLIQAVNSYLDQNPYIDIIGPWPGDGQGFDFECYFNLILDIAESVQGRGVDVEALVWYGGAHYDRLGSALDRTWPDNLTFAWANATRPMDVDHAFDTYPASEPFIQDMDNWISTHERAYSLYNWEYYTCPCFTGQVIPPYTNLIVRDVHYLYNAGSKGLEPCGEPVDQKWARNYNGYITAQLMWDRNQTAGQLINDYVNHYFAGTGSVMADFLNLYESSLASFSNAVDDLVVNSYTLEDVATQFGWMDTGGLPIHDYLDSKLHDIGTLESYLQTAYNQVGYNPEITNRLDKWQVALTYLKGETQAAIELWNHLEYSSSLYDWYCIEQEIYDLAEAWQGRGIFDDDSYWGYHERIRQAGEIYPGSPPGCSTTIIYPFEVMSCNGYGGDLCVAGENCPGVWLPATDSNRCCSQDCQSSQHQPYISLTKSANRSQTFQGDTITYTIHYHNLGQTTARQVIVQDTIPQGTSYIPGSANPPASLNGGTLSWSLGSLAAGGQGEVGFRVKVN